MQQFATKIATASHSICWLTWVALENPSRLTQKLIDKYDDEIHSVLPDVSGLRATLEYLNSNADGISTQLAKQLYALDVKVAKAGMIFIDNSEMSAELLAKLHKESIIFEQSIHKTCADIMATYPKSV